MVPHLSATEHGFSAKRSPDQAEKIPLASPTKRVIFLLRLGDDMAECKKEKQGMFSASFFVTAQVAGFGVQGSENPVGLAPKFSLSYRTDGWGRRRSDPGNCFFPEPRTLNPLYLSSNNLNCCLALIFRAFFGERTLKKNLISHQRV